LASFRTPPVRFFNREGRKSDEFWQQSPKPGPGSGLRVGVRVGERGGGGAGGVSGGAPRKPPERRRRAAAGPGRGRVVFSPLSRGAFRLFVESPVFPGVFVPVFAFRPSSARFRSVSAGRPEKVLRLFPMAVALRFSRKNTKTDPRFPGPSVFFGKNAFGSAPNPPKPAPLRFEAVIRVSGAEPPKSPVGPRDEGVFGAKSFMSGPILAIILNEGGPEAFFAFARFFAPAPQSSSSFVFFSFFRRFTPAGGAP
jgi:hypothetical protein